MAETEIESIFREYYEKKPMVDRFATEPKDAVDVLIPVIHTNELWRANLHSIYREIPVNRLMLADGGCIDKTLDIAREFPRVAVFDHKSYKSLGYSIRKLIEEVQTDWFIYLHSDVYLPPGWFEGMRKHKDEFDWFECQQQMTILAEYRLELDKTRAYSGSQMGRKAAFEKVLPKIDDDYLYRNEDIILADLIKNAGFRYGRAEEVFHYHQAMHKPSKWKRKIKAVDIQVEPARDEDIRACTMQIKGIIKYLQPTAPLWRGVGANIMRLHELGELDWDGLKKWVRETNPAWSPYLSNGWLLKQRFVAYLRAVYRKRKGAG